MVTFPARGNAHTETNLSPVGSACRTSLCLRARPNALWPAKVVTRGRRPWGEGRRSFGHRRPAFARKAARRAVGCARPLSRPRAYAARDDLEAMWRGHAPCGHCGAAVRGAGREPPPLTRGASLPPLGLPRASECPRHWPARPTGISGGTTAFPRTGGASTRAPSGVSTGCFRSVRQHILAWISTPMN
jgi:hypothetical protein